MSPLSLYGIPFLSINCPILLDFTCTNRSLLTSPFFSILTLPSIPFFKLTVPTVDTVRYEYLCMSLIRTQNPVLLVGSVGTGKTSVVESTLTKFERDEFNMLTVNMSAQVGPPFLSLLCSCVGVWKDIGSLEFGRSIYLRGPI